MTITGTGFTGATNVMFGETSTTFSAVSKSTIVAKVPAHAHGRVDVRVAVGAATSAISRADEFAYTNLRLVRSRSPWMCRGSRSAWVGAPV